MTGSATDSEPAVAFAADGRIADDMPCRGCGYNVRGLTADQECPECALPVERSLRGDLLHSDDPAWVGRLARGSRWIVIGITVGIVASSLTGFVLIPVMASGAAGGFGLAFVVGAAISFVTTLVTIVGVWWLTTPAPSDDAVGGVSARTLARWLIFFQLVTAPLQYFWAAPAWTPGASMNNLVMLIAIPPSLLVIVGQLAALMYLRQLAVRIPAPGLCPQLKRVAWGYGITNVLLLAYTLILMTVVPGVAAGTLTTGRPLGFIVGSGCVIGLGSVTFGIWAFVLIILCMVKLAACAKAAELRWGMDPPPVREVPPTERSEA